MENILTVARQVAILFALIGVGAVLHRLRLITDKTIEGLVNVLLLIVTPCLVIDVFQRPFDGSMLKGLLLAFVFAAAGHLLVIALAHFAVRHPDENICRPMRLAAVFSNAGFMGLPLEQSILGDEGVFFGVVYVVVFNLFMWTWGYCQMKGIRVRIGSVRSTVNPGTVGLAAGLPLFLCSVKLPAVLGEPVHQLANLNTPLAMLVIGYCLADMKLGRIVRLGCVYAASGIRLVAYPLLMIALMYPFRALLDRNMTLAIAIASSAPVAAMVTMFAAKYDRNVGVAVAVVSGTTVLSILTMPVIIAFAMSVL